MRKYVFLMLGFGMLFVVTGCFGKGSTEEKIYDVLEETVVLEEPFVEQQKDIASIEKREKEIFEEITSLPSDQMDEIQSLAQEAIEGIEKREDYIQKEKDSIDASKEEFDKIPSLVKELENEEAKKEAEKIVEVMNARYENFEELHTVYKETLKLEKELYTLLDSEDSEMSDVTDQLIELNENYEQVMDANEAFNESTNAYNKQKETFYKATELNITFEEN